MSLVLGIDEAGRGPVIGPLVLCGYLIESKNIRKLREIGVKDSKLLTPARRSELEKKLKKLAEDYLLITVSAKEIDKLRSVDNLNRIEIHHMKQILSLMNPSKAIVDAIEANTKAFKKKLAGHEPNGMKLVAENYADKKYPVVGAASILAKTERDRVVRSIKKQAGVEFGSGYPSDPLTVDFLKNWIDSNNSFPDYVRSSWITAQLLLEQKQQKNVSNFIGNDN